MARYRIIPTRSRVWIDARSNVHPIHTEAVGLEGWLELDASDGKINADQTTRGHLEFPIDNLKSGNPWKTAKCDGAPMLAVTRRSPATSRR